VEKFSHHKYGSKSGYSVIIAAWTKRNLHCIKSHAISHVVTSFSPWRSGFNSRAVHV